jgi:predicted PurR-regulated permease PerM
MVNHRYNYFYTIGMTTRQLLKPALFLGTAVLIVVILVYAKPFLLPLTFAGLLSMLLLPVV